MGWSKIPAPGTKLGPCAPTCQHRDCAANRADAAAVCRHCNKPIGYDTPYYCNQGVLVHAECEMKAVQS